MCMSLCVRLSVCGGGGVGRLFAGWGGGGIGCVGVCLCAYSVCVCVCVCIQYLRLQGKERVNTQEHVTQPNMSQSKRRKSTNELLQRERREFRRGRCV